MNPIAIILFLVCGWATLSVERRWAPLPLLIGCCYITMGEGIVLGPIHLPIYRMLLLVGMVRVIIRGETFVGSWNVVDKMIVVWAAWTFQASLFHLWEPGSGPLFISGVVLNLTLNYFLIRIWCSEPNDLACIVRAFGILLLPIAFEMLFEKATSHNLFSIFGGVPAITAMREGRLRAQGPFRHPILAGTVGAACLPMFLGIWRQHRQSMTLAIAASVTIVIASASSGPLFAAAAGVGALCIWRTPKLALILRRGAVLLYLILMMTMKQPPYYLLGRLNVIDGSTGW